MKFTAGIATLAVVLPLVAAVPAANINNQAGAGKIQTLTAVKATAAAAKPTAAAATKATAASAAKSPAVNVAAAASNATAASTSAAAAAATSVAAAASASDLQTSLTLDPNQVNTGSGQNGQQNPEAGQVDSDTSNNNFINNCANFPQLPLTNGQQILTGSCNPIPMGVIPAKKNQPSAKITNPPNGATIQSNTTFNFDIAITNLDTGFFTNADLTYFAAPQKVNPSSGNIQGHSHVVANIINGLQDAVPTDTTKFAFFKGLNAAAVGGVLTAAVTGGLPANTYRACTINTGANHAPILGPVAQHASFDDCTYFTVTDDASQVSSAANLGGGAAAASGAGAAASGAAASSAASGAAASSAAAGSAASTSAAAAAASSAPAANGAAAKTGSQGNNNKNSKGFRGGRGGRGRF